MTLWILSASLLILAVILLRLLLRGRISYRLQYALWGIVLLRLLIPGSIGHSAVSVKNALLSNETIQTVDVLEHYDRIWHRADGTVEGRPSYEPVPDMQYVIARDASPAEFQRMETILTARQLFTGIWLTGVVVMLGIFLFSNRKLRRQLTSLSWHTYEACPLPVFVTHALEGPCLFGFFRPAIYLPPAVWDDPITCRHAVAHEETHYRHKDHLWVTLRCLALALHWYNPLVWLAARLAYQDSELACDEGTIARLGQEERIRYGHTLLDLTCGKRMPLRTATTMVNSPGQLRERITAIAHTVKTRRLAVAAAVLVLCILSVSAFTGARSDSAAADPGPSIAPGTVTPADVRGVTRIELTYTREAFTGSFATNVDSDHNPMVQMLQRSVRLDYAPNCIFGLQGEITLDTGEKLPILLATDGCTVWSSESSYYHYDGDNAFLLWLVSAFLLEDAIEQSLPMEDIAPMLQYLDWRQFCPLPHSNREKAAMAMAFLEELDDWCKDPDIDSDTRYRRMYLALPGTRNLEGSLKDTFADMLAAWLRQHPEEFSRAFIDNRDTATRTNGMELLKPGTGKTEQELVKALNTAYAAYLERVDAAEAELWRNSPPFARFDLTYAGSVVTEFTAAIGEVTLLQLECGDLPEGVSTHDIVWSTPDPDMCTIESHGATALITITDTGTTEVVVRWNGYQTYVLVHGKQAWSAE